MHTQRDTKEKPCECFFFPMQPVYYTGRLMGHFSLTALDKGEKLPCLPQVERTVGVTLITIKAAVILIIEVSIRKH